jgi:F0F1-type ATP synthase membrane subunit b/b'
MTGTRIIRAARGLWRTAASVIVLLMLVAAPALAQEGEPSPADTTTGWVFRWLNFVLVFGATAWAIAKYGAPYFRQHADEISRQIAEGTRAREAAERQRAEMQAKLAGLDDEVMRIRATAKIDADAEAQRLRDQAHDEAKKIERVAREEIAAAEREAGMELKTLGARLALDRAETLVRQEITQQAEETLFREFVAELQESFN